MRAAFPLCLCLTFAIASSGETPATLQYESLPGVSIYSAGYLFSWDSPKYSQVTLYGRDAKPAYSMTEQKDGIYHSAWAVDSDGVAARAYRVRYVWQGRIDLFDPSGALTLTINTGSYIPDYVAFFRDHTIWTVGYNAGNDGSEDFNVLHHYSRTGQELGQALPWSQIAGDNNSYSALQELIGGRQLYISDDRIGFRSHSHGDGQNTWIEATPSGVLAGKYDLGLCAERCYEPVTMTAGGAVYARIYKEHVFDGWATLDRSGKAWHKLTGYPKGKIIGSNGDNLMFSKRVGGWTVLRLVPSESLKIENTAQETAALVTQPAHIQ